MSEQLELDASVVKSGETPIEIYLSRRAEIGLRVQVKTFPQIEEYMRNLGTGTHIQVELSGRHWRPLKKDGAPLMAYDLMEKLGDKDYLLDSLGQPLFNPNNDGVHMPNIPPNISFLRLVGVSEGPGVSFQLRGVFSETAERELAIRLQKAATQFFLDYIRPVDFIVKVSMQEIKGRLEHDA